MTRLDWQRTMSSGDAAAYALGLTLDGYRRIGDARREVYRHPDGRECESERISPRKIRLTHWTRIERDSAAVSR